VILQKIDEIICNLLTQINILNIEIINIKNEIININNNITNIYNILGECCTTTTSTSSSSTTTSTTTIHPCENFSLTNTGVDPVAIIITDCDTGEPDAIILYPGDTNICVVTDSPLTVPGTIVVVPNGPCDTSTTTTTSSSSTSTTSTSSTSSTTTTTTTAIPCECLTFENTDDIPHFISYNDCDGTTFFPEILANETLQFCGCCGYADSELVFITIGADCIGGLCPGISTTTTTTAIPNCNFTGTANQLPDSTTTTTTSSSSSTTTSTTTAGSTTTTTTTTIVIPCDCLTFNNTGDSEHSIAYTNCEDFPVVGIPINPSQIIQVCGHQPLVNDPSVIITEGAACILGACPTTTTTTTVVPTTTTTTTVVPTTTTTTTVCVNCIPGNVTIGTQVWTGCNLNITTFANGDPIPEVSDPTAWAALTTPAWCYYNNDSANGPIYGKIYNWYAVNDPRGLAPSGYHVPSDSEWTTLTTFLGGLSVAGSALKQTGLCHWNVNNIDATNSTGFSALGGGLRDSFGAFSNLGFSGNWWPSSLLPSTDYYYRLMTPADGIVYRNFGSIPTLGFSVRLVQD
jgi:uncharacterized protein (TIGR02145 family)